MFLRNKHQILLKLLAVLVLAQLFLPYTVLAQQRADAPPTGFERICSTHEIVNGQKVPIDGALPVCIKKIYLFSLGFGALVGMFMLVTAGYRYMTAAGNAEQVASAKDTFTSTFTGLIIIFIAFILLYLINPDLTQFTKITPPEIKFGTSGNNTNTNTAGAITVNATGIQPFNQVGDPVQIDFTVSPAGSYTWVFDNCAGDYLPSGLSLSTANPPKITGTVAADALISPPPYYCKITASSGGRSGSKTFEFNVYN